METAMEPNEIAAIVESALHNIDEAAAIQNQDLLLQAISLASRPRLKGKLAEIIEFIDACARTEALCGSAETDLYQISTATLPDAWRGASGAAAADVLRTLADRTKGFAQVFGTSQAALRSWYDAMFGAQILDLEGLNKLDQASVSDSSTTLIDMYTLGRAGAEKRLQAAKGLSAAAKDFIHALDSLPAPSGSKRIEIVGLPPKPRRGFLPY